MKASVISMKSAGLASRSASNCVERYIAVLSAGQVRWVASLRAQTGLELNSQNHPNGANRWVTPELLRL